MIVILDANVIKKDFMVNSIDFKNLFDFLTKTQSKIVFPQIVWQEIRNLYYRDLEERYKDYEDSFFKMNLLLTDSLNAQPTIDVEEKTANYMDYIKRNMDLEDEDIVEYKHEYLPKVVSRAINRIKPCSSKGQEFRDTLLWLTILDIAGENSEDNVIFISHNTKDFASSNDKEVLHPDLAKETKNLNIDVRYYNSLSQFIQRHATKIKFVDEEWVKGQINIDTVNEHFLDILSGQEEDSIVSYAEYSLNHNCTGYINVCGTFLKMDDFFVYEKSDSNLYLEVILSGEIEVEVEVEKEVDKKIEKYEYEYVFDPHTNDMGLEMVPKTRFVTETITGFEYIYPEYELKLGANIKNEKLDKYIIKDYERL